jgi:hypothetical protein
MTTLNYLDESRIEARDDKPLWYHLQGLSQTASGYGRKLTTTHRVKVDGRWHRVYVCQYSNAGTAYIVKGGDWMILN